MAQLSRDVGSNNLIRPTGMVDLLIGIQVTEIYSTIKLRAWNLQLLSSQFGTGYLLDGTHHDIKPHRGKLIKLDHSYCQERVVG